LVERFYLSRDNEKIFKIEESGFKPASFGIKITKELKLCQL